MGRIKNYFLCKKYPFLKMYNAWNGKFMGYKYTWYDDIPEGWQKAFGKQLLEELKSVLIEESASKDFRFTQIKEKWGNLRLYTNGTTDKIQTILEKYELLSECYCIKCGKPARYVSIGWVEYYCEDCKNELKYANNNLTFKRLSKEDIPHISYRNPKTGKMKRLDTKKEYGIDFEEKWNL